MRTAFLTTLAMLAFAGNSVLCRLALGRGLIDAASFATIRVVSGAVVLALIVLLRSQSGPLASAGWRPASMLFVYLVCFSFAYISLDAGTGALILFGAVQLTMIVAGLRAGERLSPPAWSGFVLAVFGLAWLVSPGVTAPDALGALLMALAGAAWGAYSLLGRGGGDPLQQTTGNFLLAAVPTAIVMLLFVGGLHATPPGLALAAVSGAVTSGLGYVVWYAALRELSATHAATVQLTVPVIAAFGGIVWLSEPLTVRLLMASAATLGGVWLVLAQRAARKPPKAAASV